MEKEKEVRYKINKEQIKKIKLNTTPYKDRIEMIDITCGYEGFDSYSKYGFICRVRQKGDKKTLEVKNYLNSNECIEQEIKLEKIEDGINYLKLIGMKPYLYLKRFREVRKYKDLKIFIDEFDIIGNYVEIEYQDSNDSKKQIEDFFKLIGIKSLPQDMYGSIVREKLVNDLEFKKLFNKKLEKVLTKK